MDDGRRHDPSLAFPWYTTGALPTTLLPPHSHPATASPASSASLLDFGTSPPSSDFSFTPGSFRGLAEVNPTSFELEDRNSYSNWLVNDLLSAPASSNCSFTHRPFPDSPEVNPRSFTLIDCLENFDNHLLSAAREAEAAADKQSDSGKRHACPHCAKRFNRPISLAIHVNTHTGDKPFGCPFPDCGRRFHVDSNMRRHYRKHLPPTTPQAPRQGSSFYSSQGSAGLDARVASIDERVTSILDYPPPPWGIREPPYSPPRIQLPPNKLHPTLSSWLKNINKLDSLIDRLQELAYSAPTDQLLNKVTALRATVKKQQERCIEFLQLSDDYANKYLLDIDAEIRQQSTLLDSLEERLEAAKRLHGDAVDLQLLYESQTVASMNNLRVTGISRPLPEDNALFKEVDLVMAEIRRFYEELNKFWREEICYVVEALKKRRVDPRDLERWDDFRSSLKQTIESWPNRPPTGDTQTVKPSNNTCRSTGVDLGTIASSLSSTSGSFADALERISSSASLRYSPLSRPPFQRAFVAFARNSNLCLSFLRHCAEYSEKVFTWCNSFNASPMPSRMGASHDLRERTASLLSEMTSISTENVAGVEGSRRCKATYKRAWALEQKTTSELNTLLENLSSWAAVIDGPSGDAPIDEVRPQELGELKCAWEKTRDSLRSALETLTSEPVHHHRSSQAFMRCRSALRRWMTSIVSFS